MGTPNPSSVRQGTPTSNQHHHEGFHLPCLRGRRHGRGRPPVPLQQLLQLLPQHLRLRRRLQPLHLRQLLRQPPLLQARGRGRGRPRPCLQHRCPRSPLPHDLRHPQLRLQPCRLPLHLRPPPLRQERGRGRAPVLRQLLLQALRLLQDLRLLQLQALLLRPLRLQGILLSDELTKDDQGFRPRPRPKTKNREEPLSEETLHKTKLTDDVGPKKKSHI